jgi:hypothetical protein
LQSVNYVADACGRAVDRRVHVQAMREDAGGPGSLQRDIHLTREGTTGLRVWGPEDYRNPLNFARMSSKSREQPVLGIRSDLGADGVVLGSDLYTHEFMSYKARLAPTVRGREGC